MKSSINIFLFLLLAVLMQSCDSDKQEPCKDSYTTVNLTDFQKTRCPYTGSDTLVFVSDQNDTAYCYGIGKSTYFIQTSKRPNPDGCSLHTAFETIEYSYSCNNALFTNSLKIIIGLGGSNIESFKIKLTGKDFSEDVDAIIDVNYKQRVTIFNKTHTAMAFRFYAQDSLYYNHTDGIIRVALFNQAGWNVLK
ncbi:MAG: hypothetical protein V4590_10410 [Bacteroidota bacterium]